MLFGYDYLGTMADYFETKYLQINRGVFGNKGWWWIVIIWSLIFIIIFAVVVFLILVIIMVVIIITISIVIIIMVIIISPQALAWHLVLWGRVRTSSAMGPQCSSWCAVVIILTPWWLTFIKPVGVGALLRVVHVAPVPASSLAHNDGNKHNYETHKTKRGSCLCWQYVWDST